MTPTKSTLTPLLLVDIDGTIREGPREGRRVARSADDVVLLPGAAEAVAAWTAAGWRVVGISNQADVGLGRMTADQLAEAMKATIDAAPGLRAILSCMHAPADDCFCRKPATGLVAGVVEFLSGQFPTERYGSRTTALVGDSDCDRECARRAQVAFLDAAAWRAMDGPPPLVRGDDGGLVVLWAATLGGGEIR